jgi:exodeoxyribonuclease VII small subunit
MPTKKPAKTAKATKAAINAKPLSYRELSEQLEAVMAKLQNPDCDVDEAVGLYEAAVQYIAQLEEHLRTAKNRVTKVQAEFTEASGPGSGQ